MLRGFYRTGAMIELYLCCTADVQELKCPECGGQAWKVQGTVSMVQITSPHFLYLNVPQRSSLCPFIIRLHFKLLQF